jgi:hypothetical protein
LQIITLLLALWLACIIFLGVCEAEEPTGKAQFPTLISVCGSPYQLIKLPYGDGDFRSCDVNYRWLLSVSKKRAEPSEASDERALADLARCSQERERLAAVIAEREASAARAAAKAGEALSTCEAGRGAAGALAGSYQRKYNYWRARYGRCAKVLGKMVR